MLNIKTLARPACSIAILFSFFIFHSPLAQDAETLFRHQIEAEIALASEQYESAIEHIREQVRFYPAGHHETFVLYDKIGGIYWSHLNDYPAAVRAYAQGRNWITILDFLEQSRKRAEKFVDLLPNVPKIAASNQSDTNGKASDDTPTGAAFREMILQTVPALCEEDVQRPSCRRFILLGSDDRSKKALLQKALGCYEEAAQAFSEIYAENMPNAYTYFWKSLNKIYMKYPALAVVSPFEHPETLKVLRQEHPEDADLGEMEAFLNLVMGVLEEVKQDKTKHPQRTLHERFESFCKSHPESEWLILGPLWASTWQRSSGHPWAGEKLLKAMPYLVYEHSKNAFFRAMVKPRLGRNAIPCDEECQRVIRPYLKQIPPGECIDVVHSLSIAHYADAYVKVYELDSGDAGGLPVEKESKDVLYIYLKDFLKDMKGYSGSASYLKKMESLKAIASPALRIQEAERRGKQVFQEFKALPKEERSQYRRHNLDWQFVDFYGRRQLSDYLLRLCRSMFRDFPEPQKRKGILGEMEKIASYYSPDEGRLLGIVAWLEKGFPDYPIPATLFFAIAEFYRSEERYDDALTYYLKAADAPAESGEAAEHFLYVGGAYAYLGEWEEALSWWAKAARQPCSHEAYHRTQQSAAKKLTEYYRGRGEYRTAFEASAPVSLAYEDCTFTLGGQRMDRIVRLFDDWTRFEDPETVVSLLERYLASVKRGTWWRAPLRIGEIYRRLGWLERLQKFIAEHASKDTEPDIMDLPLFATLEKYLALVEQYGKAPLKDVVAALQQASKLPEGKRGLSTEGQFKVEFLYQELKRFKPEKRFRFLQSLLEEAPPSPPKELLRALVETEHPEALCYLVEKAAAGRGRDYLDELWRISPYVALPCVKTVLTEAQKDDPTLQQIRIQLQGHVNRLWGR